MQGVKPYSNDIKYFIDICLSEKKKKFKAISKDLKLK